MNLFNQCMKPVTVVSRQRALVLKACALACALTSLPVFAERTSHYHYNDLGLITSMDGPRTDINDHSTYSYDNKGQLIRTVNALGHTTQITAYDSAGRPLTIVDANGVTIELSYHLRGWLTELRVRHPSNASQDLVTIYDYDALGQLITTTLPDGSSTEFVYDDARRLIRIRNNLGESMDFTPDAAGNITEEQIRDASGTLRYSLARTFDELSRVRSLRNALGDTVQTDYDVNDNPVTETSGRGHVHQHSFDALDRLTQQLDPLAGETQFAYDAQDRITQVTDANGLSTHYRYNGFGDLIQQNSPDTGITDFTYDNAGNRISEADARGIMAMYRYDALNRLTHKEFPNAPEQNLTYTYDDTANGNHGIGRLTQVEDASGITRYRYDHLGNILEKTYTIHDQSFSQSYRYDAAGRLMEWTYPSGLVVDYSYDSQGRVERVSTSMAGQTTNTLVSNIDYLPFGPATAIHYGNGLTQSMLYDQDYRPTNITTGSVQQLSYRYDANGNITHIDHLDQAANNQGFTYDVLDRLFNSTGNYGEIDYRYDPVGNRLRREQQRDGTFYNDVYNYILGSNQLSDIDQDHNGQQSERLFSYDEQGNPIRIEYSSAVPTVLESTYNAANRLAEITTASTHVTYTYNALGQRTHKTVTDAHSGPDNDGVLTFDNTRLGSFNASQDDTTSGAVTVSDNNASLSLQGNRWQSLMLAQPYTVTANTMFEVDVVATNSGEILGLGFETDSTLSADRFVQLSGSQNWANRSYPYTTLGQTQRITIPLSQIVSGTIDRIVFAADDDANAAVQASFSQPRLYEASGQTPPPPTSQTIVFNSNNVSAFGGSQDDSSTGAVTIENDGTTLSLQGNRWQSVQLASDYILTPNTMIEFDVNASNTGEIIGIGIETDNTITQSRFYQIEGSQNWANASTRYTTLGETQRITLAIGQSQIGTFNRIAFAADDDVNSSTDVRYSNVRVYEAGDNNNIGGNNPDNTSAGSTTIHYLYNDAGQLLGEYTPQGDVIVEYLWLNGQPLAQRRGNATYTYHNDHLGTPTVITDQAQNTVWSATYTPFGEASITTQAIENNLRFPGQYYDQESQTHYNYFRTYDPSTGRYLQSDPIGLDDGPNTYAYVHNNPITGFDPDGLRNQGDGRRASGSRSGGHGKHSCQEECWSNFLTSSFAAVIVGYGVSRGGPAVVGASSASGLVIQGGAHVGGSINNAVGYFQVSECLKKCDDGQCE